MQLIGMLDSPYVRRVAVSLLTLGIPFTHRSVSVFRGFDEFKRINPVVKAPTLVCDDGTVLMDSTLILEYVEALSHPRTLLPTDPRQLQQDLRILGLALAACEKAVQIVYERDLRPVEKQHQPWFDRVTGQLRVAFEQLEAEFARRPGVSVARLDQVIISSAVAWQFARRQVPGVIDPVSHPTLGALSEAAEALPQFRAAPFDGELDVAALRS